MAATLDAEGRASHLHLLPPPALGSMDHMMTGAAIVTRLTQALDAGDHVAASNARADLRRFTAEVQELKDRPVDLAPYRTATPPVRPLPLLIVIEPDPAVFAAFVKAEGISRARVKRCSTFFEAHTAETIAELEGRPAMTIEEARS